MKPALCLALALVGCAANIKWQAPETSGNFDQDNGQCASQAYAATAGLTGPIASMRTQAIYENCMKGKGWRKSA